MQPVLAIDMVALLDALELSTQLLHRQWLVLAGLVTEDAAHARRRAELMQRPQAERAEGEDKTRVRTPGQARGECMRWSLGMRRHQPASAPRRRAGRLGARIW